jgi:hypothetical protein
MPKANSVLSTPRRTASKSNPPDQPTTRDDELGMAWWNNLTERERAEWSAIAGNTGRPKDAWEAFRRGSVDQSPPVDPTRRRFLAVAAGASVGSLAVAAAMPVTAPAMPVDVDPIFAAIDEFQEADASWSAAIDAIKDNEDVPDAIWDRRDLAEERVIRTSPTSPAGLAALTTWTRARIDWMRTVGSSDYHDEIYAMVAAIDDATRGMSGLEAWSPAAVGQTNDAELIQLGARLEPLVESYYAARAVWAPALFSANREIDREFGEDWHSESRRAAQEQAWAKAGVDEASDKMETIVKKIKTLAKAVHMLPARSLDGLRAHVLVAFWENAPMGAGDLEYDFEDEVVHQRLFVAAADACGLSGHIASKGFVLPFPEFDEIDDEDEDEAAVEPA